MEARVPLAPLPPLPTAPAPVSPWFAAAAGDAGAGRAGQENFPVASFVLPRAARRHLMAIYALARVIDDTGDEAPGDRLALLDELAADIRLVPAGSPRIGVVRNAVPTVRECDLDISLLLDLVEANRVDQVVTRYATTADLHGYCRLSADPVGRLVLGVFGLVTPVRAELSDLVCTALQLAEHLQDVGEDLAAGRVYLPQESLDRHDVRVQDLAEGTRPANVAALLAEEAGRARHLLERGRPLVDTLSGRPRLAVALFLAGGHATLDAIFAAGAAAVDTTPRARPLAVLRRMPGLLKRGGAR